MVGSHGNLIQLILPGKTWIPAGKCSTKPASCTEKIIPNNGLYTCARHQDAACYARGQFKSRCSPMPLYEPTFPYRYVKPLIEILREHDPARVRSILVEAGLDGIEEEQADLSLPMARFDRLMSVASARLGRLDLGFEMGQRITIENHSPLWHAIQRCETLEELLLLLERYYHLVTPTFTARYLPGDRHCEWRIRVTAPMSQETLHMCLELQSVSIHRDILRMFGPDTRMDIHLSIPPPPHRARYDRLPYTHFFFGSEALPEVRCVIPTELVRRCLSRPRDRKEAGGGAVRSSSPSGLQQADRYGEWVGLMLREAQTVQPTVPQLAALLNMSARTLARKLTAEGINFRELSTRIRHERACTLLANPDVPMHQIAYQLGYSDITAFIRGFRKQSGITPALYRERND
jgi:AraC-like DNA-binding protein